MPIILFYLLFYIIMSPTDLLKEYFPNLSQEMETQMLQFMEDLSV